ncbi:MAG: DUF3575 domain-containing protein [Bacteroidia bacterium]
MKNIYEKILFLFAIFFSMNSFSQSSEAKEPIGFIIKADVFLPSMTLVENREHYSSNPRDSHTQHFFSVTLEKKLKQRQSIQLTGSYSYDNFIHNSVDVNVKSKIFSIIPEYKFFILKNKPITGPYIGTYLLLENEQFSDVEYLYNKYDYNNIKLGAGLSTGYQFYIKNRIVIDALFGFGLKKIINGNSSDHQIHYWEFDGRLALNVVYIF